MAGPRLQISQDELLKKLYGGLNKRPRPGETAAVPVLPAATEAKTAGPLAAEEPPVDTAALLVKALCDVSSAAQSLRALETLYRRAVWPRGEGSIFTTAAALAEICKKLSLGKPSSDSSQVLARVTTVHLQAHGKDRGFLLPLLQLLGQLGPPTAVPAANLTECRERQRGLCSAFLLAVWPALLQLVPSFPGDAQLAAALCDATDWVFAHGSCSPALLSSETLYKFNVPAFCLQMMNGATALPAAAGAAAPAGPVTLLVAKPTPLPPPLQLRVFQTYLPFGLRTEDSRALFQRALLQLLSTCTDTTATAATAATATTERKDGSTSPQLSLAQLWNTLCSADLTRLMGAWDWRQAVSVGRFCVAEETLLLAVPIATTSENALVPPTVQSQLSRLIADSLLPADVLAECTQRGLRNPARNSALHRLATAALEALEAPLPATMAPIWRVAAAAAVHTGQCPLNNLPTELKDAELVEQLLLLHLPVSQTIQLALLPALHSAALQRPSVALRLLSALVGLAIGNPANTATVNQLWKTNEREPLLLNVVGPLFFAYCRAGDGKTPLQDEAVAVVVLALQLLLSFAAAADSDSILQRTLTQGLTAAGRAPQPEKPGKTQQQQSDRLGRRSLAACIALALERFGSSRLFCRLLLPPDTFADTKALLLCVDPELRSVGLEPLVLAALKQHGPLPSLYRLASLLIPGADFDRVPAELSECLARLLVPHLVQLHRPPHHFSYYSLEQPSLAVPSYHPDTAKAVTSRLLGHPRLKQQAVAWLRSNTDSAEELAQLLLDVALPGAEDKVICETLGTAVCRCQACNSFPADSKARVSPDAVRAALMKRPGEPDCPLRSLLPAGRYGFRAFVFAALFSTSNDHWSSLVPRRVVQAALGNKELRPYWAHLAAFAELASIEIEDGEVMSALLAESLNSAELATRACALLRPQAVKFGAVVLEPLVRLVHRQIARPFVLDRPDEVSAQALYELVNRSDALLLELQRLFCGPGDTAACLLDAVMAPHGRARPGGRTIYCFSADTVTALCITSPEEVMGRLLAHGGEKARMSCFQKTQTRALELLRRAADSPAEANQALERAALLIKMLVVSANQAKAADAWDRTMVPLLVRACSACTHVTDGTRRIIQGLLWVLVQYPGGRHSLHAAGVLHPALWSSDPKHNDCAAVVWILEKLALSRRIAQEIALSPLLMEVLRGNMAAQSSSLKEPLCFELLARCISSTDPAWLIPLLEASVLGSQGFSAPLLRLIQGYSVSPAEDLAREQSHTIIQRVVGTTGYRRLVRETPLLLAAALLDKAPFPEPLFPVWEPRAWLPESVGICANLDKASSWLNRAKVRACCVALEACCCVALEACLRYPRSVLGQQTVAALCRDDHKMLAAATLMVRGTLQAAQRPKESLTKCPQEIKDRAAAKLPPFRPGRTTREICETLRDQLASVQATGSLREPSDPPTLGPAPEENRQQPVPDFPPGWTDRPPPVMC